MSHQHQHHYSYWQHSPPFPPTPAEFPQYAFADVRPQHNQPDYPPPTPYSQQPHPQYYSYSSPPAPLPPLSVPQPQNVYPDPRSPLQPNFGSNDMYTPMPGAFDYQVPDMADLNIEDRPPSPQYVGRRSKSKPRSRASSKASISTRPTSRVEHRSIRGRKRAIAAPPPPPPGYKPPYIESVENSPVLLPSLPSESQSLLEEDEEYIKYFQKSIAKAAAYANANAATQVAEPQKSKRGKSKKRPPVPSFPVPEQDQLPQLERDRTPYASSSATTSTAASSPPPEKFPLERERRQYGGATAKRGSDAESELHGGNGGGGYAGSDGRRSPVMELERKRRQYGGSSAYANQHEEMERDGRQYSGGGNDADPMPPEAVPRKPQPYSLHPEAGSRQSQHYSVQPEPPVSQQQYSVPPDPAPALPRQSRPYQMPSDASKRYSQHYPTQSEPDYSTQAAPPRQSQPYSMHPQPECHSPPPPETAPRQSQPYSMHREPSYDIPPEAAPRQSQPYSMHQESKYSPPPPEAAPRQSQPYAMQPGPVHAIPVETTPRQPQPYSMHKESYDKLQEANPRQPQPYPLHQEQVYSPPPEAAPRQSQPYSMHWEPIYEKPQETAPRQSQPYSTHQEPSYSPPPPETAPRQSQPYSMRPEPEYSSPPPETAPRQPQPYSMQPDSANSKSTEFAPRHPQPYSGRSDQSSHSPQSPYPKASETTPRQSQTFPSPTSTASRRANPYAYSERPQSRDDLRPSKSPGVTQSPRQPPPPPESPHHAHSLPNRAPESPRYAQSQSNSTKSQHSVPAASRFEAPALSDPAPPSPTQDNFAQSLVHRPTTPSSEYLSDLIPACPKRRPVSRGVWYGVPGISNFHVCERCYELHIYDTAFIKYFTEVKLAEGQKTFCAFNTPRVLNYVWPKTIEENVFEIFKSYAAGRSSIGTCTGMDASAKKGVWYTIKNSPRGGFIACQACYQDVILATPFHSFFGPLEATVSENTISCHVAWPFIEARLLNTPTSSWDEIQRDIEYRLLKVPACPGDKLIKDTGRRWWKPKGTAMPLYICDCCYWDGIYPTVFSGEFDLVVQGRKQAWCCAMSGYQLSTVWQHAAEKKQFNSWLEAANAALSPMCHYEGSSGQIWNVFKDPALDGFDFCERCTDVFIRPLGFGNRLEKRRYAAEENIKCDLNPANEYQTTLLRELGEAAAWRDFGIVKRYLSQLAPHVYKPPSCPGELAVSRPRWWGCEGFKVCEECYIERVKPSPFASYVKGFDLLGAPEELSCDLGTPDWRYIWQKRAERRDFDSFIEAITLKNKLDDVRLQRVEAMEEMREKSRRGLFPDERRRLQGLLNVLQEEERDTTNMLAALTRV